MLTAFPKLTPLGLLFCIECSASSISPEAKFLRNSLNSVIESTERSHALFGAKAAAISQIWELVNECAEYEGNDTIPLNAIAAKEAENFVRALPDDIPLPEFTPEPDGAISLDWIQSRNRIFSISIGITNRLPYAWLDGTDRGHAVAHFDGNKIPTKILQGIEAITNQKDATLRIA